jgi:hypothetical protein
MKSSTWVVGMNATPTRWEPCCILVCRMTTSQNKFSWSKGPSGGVWTIAYNSTWWPCSYKGNVPSMPTKTIVKYINFKLW